MVAMTRENAIAEIKRNWHTFYPADKKGGIICPLCGNGSGESGTGITENPNNPGQLHCFKCGFGGDILDLLQQDKSMTFNEALSYSEKALGIIDRSTENDRTESPTTHGNSTGDIETPFEAKSPQNANKSVTGANADYTEYYRQCAERLNDPVAVSYLKGRGISVDTAAAFNIGYDPAADPAQSGYTSARIIIPTTKGHYIGRSTDPKTDKKFAKLNNKGGKPGIFNEAALYDELAEHGQPLFITEGAFDAMSIAEAGAAAIALNSTSNADLLIKKLTEKPTAATLILSLDNDDAGKKATQILADGLQRLNISYVIQNIAGAHKDANEALQSGRDTFLKAIEQAFKTAIKPDNVENYINRLMVGEIQRFKKEIKTGYSNLDAKAGGIYSGLYCIAAITSLGKTTFAAQMADQIAAAGNDVIFFTLEQSRLELVAKSLARITAQNDIQTAVNSLEIRKGYLPSQVLNAADQYTAAVKDHLSIVEGNFNCTVEYIGEYIRQYQRRTFAKPVVFIDYLQILQGDPSKRQNTKELMDSTVTELKRISRNEDLPIFIISSVNRANYLTPIDFESIKESGGIEYTCDVVYGLQLECLNEDLFSQDKKIKEKRERIKEAKAANPRKIQLVCLKNRYGRTDISCSFNYNPEYDLFTPAEDKEQLKPGRRI